jgi:UDP-N-acetylmuramoylalanine-D-glutamate ligase
MMPGDLGNGASRGEAFLAALKGTRVAVISLGRQTSAAARLLHGAGARVRLEPVFTTADLTGEELIVVTTAAALESSAVVEARESGVAVLGELDLAWCVTEADLLAMAGSAAGTAVRFVRAILARQGRPVVTADSADFGSLAAAPGLGAGGLVLVEPSPAQLATAQCFRPWIAAVLAGFGAPDVVRSLTAHQTPRDCAVLDADDADARALARETQGRVLWYSAAGALDNGASPHVRGLGDPEPWGPHVYVERDRIAARLNGHVEDIGPIVGLPRGVLTAALAAVTCALWIGMAPETIGAALASRARPQSESSEARQPSGRASAREPASPTTQPSGRASAREPASPL